MNKKVFFIFCFAVALTQGMRIDQKPLRPEFVGQITHGNKWAWKFGEWWSKVWTAQSLYDHCKEGAFSVDAACYRLKEEMPEGITCDVFSFMQRHLRCWWLYKQALSLAIHGPTDEMLAQERIPNTAFEGSSYQWCQTPQDWYDQCNKICNRSVICTDEGRDRYCTVFDHMSCHRKCKKKFQENIQKVKATITMDKV